MIQPYGVYDITLWYLEQVSSTDKNFMVPVGGGLIASPDKQLVAEVGKMYPGLGQSTPNLSQLNPKPLSQVGKMYPGRASIAPVLDLFITLLSMGKAGLKIIEMERVEIFCYA